MKKKHTGILTNRYQKDGRIHIVKTKVETGLISVNGISKFYKIKTPLSDIGYLYILNPTKLDEVFGNA